MAPPLVSALILNYRTPADVAKCVRALKSQTIADRIEIVVIDNHSDDDSVGRIRNQLLGIGGVRIVETPLNLGFGGGNNYGARYVGGEYLLIINPDTELEPGGIERMVAMLREDPTIGILAPKLQFPDGTIRDSYRTFPTFFDVIIKRTFFRYLFPRRLKHYLQHDTDPGLQRDIDWVVGACMFMRRGFYEQLRGFDERFFLFFEDTDLCRRCWDRGKRVVYCPEVHAADRKQRLSGGGFLPLFLTKTGRIHVISAVKYFWKWRGARRVLAA
ncbi:hypothetical protein A3J91_03640 [Candidatus Peribacteria bacterium RIFOXYC2_FULL_58_10]|nr:MAG: hypothetical protein A3J91_03640 [Candidatus Peribacteria bacterium RIFOXYC2_FULL_58_10]OGJ85267.1 MAG: hypothetical protein A2529_02275 [Candidatus Peribacteria bacterium RIFOXYD2_FULL_58_15]